MNRRSFLELGRLLVGAALAAAALPPALFWWRSARRPAAAPSPWADAGSPRKLEEGIWTRRVLSFERRDLWRREIAREAIFVRRRGRRLEVLSAICPHTACLVKLEGEGFACPCHKSAFGSEGEVLDGPSPRPLDPLEWKVEKGQLLVRYRRYRPGLAERAALPG